MTNQTEVDLWDLLHSFMLRAVDAGHNYECEMTDVCDCGLRNILRRYNELLTKRYLPST